MSDRQPSPEIDLSWRMREQEAMLLAELMRSSRLTLLHAEPEISRTQLLKGGLLPLLRRRTSDAVGDEDRESRVVIPFSDRRLRRAGRSSTRVAERVVLFDNWGADPLVALQAAILGSLPEDAITYARSSRLAPRLGELSRRFDAHFLIILDSFERFWDPALTREAAEQFVDELSEAVNLDNLRAHFLLSIDDLAEPRLDALRQRIHGFDDSALHLLRWPGTAIDACSVPMPLDETRATVEPVYCDSAMPVLLDAVLSPPRWSPLALRGGEDPLALPTASPAISSHVPVARSSALEASTPVAIPRKARRPRPPRVPFVKPEPIKTEGVYAFIESTLSQTASDFAPWQEVDVLPAGDSTSGPQDSSVRQNRASGLPGTSGVLPGAARAARPMSGAGRERSSRVDESLVEPPSPIDRWLDFAFASARRLLRKK